jgi:epsilon-lactone hydrolase
MASKELAGLIASLRAGELDLAATPAKARADFNAMTAAAPLPSDVARITTILGGVPALLTTTPDCDPSHTLLYFHGGAYVIGSAQSYQTLSAALGRSAGARALSVEYRLAPEHPFPAAVDDAVAAYTALLADGCSPDQIVVAGDSAGGGLTLAMMLKARDSGLPMPAAALLLSPWVDLNCNGSTMQSRATADPSLRKEALLSMARHYLAGQNPQVPLASPLFADLTGLPPLLIQVGTAEILLDDSLRLAQRAALAQVRTQLSVWPEMVHVWQFFAFMLPEGRAAIDEGGLFLRHALGASN